MTVKSETVKSVNMKTVDQQVNHERSFDRAAYCTTKQAAERIGVSHRTVQMWVENGTLQAWKTAGGHRRITLASVERLLDDRRTALGGACAAPRPARPAPRVQCEARAGARSVLIVDDDAMLLRLYELEISTWGLDLAVRKASNGLEALARIGEARPDILVSDLHMPGLDGFGMIQALRGDPGTASLPLVVVSGMDKPTVLSRGLPDDIAFLTKPAPLAALRAAVTARLPAAS